jgi:hypothetical protein
MKSSPVRLVSIKRKMLQALLAAGMGHKKAGWGTPGRL